MRIFLRLFVLLLLCPFMLQAQTNYQPGYIVTLEGDTIRGFINYREWDSTPAAIAFREGTKTGTEMTVTAGNAQYVEITGMDAYRRYQGVMTMNPVSETKATYNTSLLSEQVEVFLRVELKGPVADLLSHNDKIKTRLFYLEKNGEGLKEFFYSRYFASSNSNKVIVQKGYIGQLQHLIDKNNLSSKITTRDIEYVQYNVMDFQNIFAKLNETAVAVNRVKPTNDKPYRFFAGVALNTSTFRILGITGLHAPERNPASFMPLLSFGFDSFLNKHIQRLYLRVEGALTAANYQADNNIQSENIFYYFSYNVSQQTFSVSPQLLYSIYNTDKLKFNLGAVTQLNFSHYTENHFQFNRRATFSSSPDVVSEEGYKDFLRTEPFWFAYGFRVGAIVNQKLEFYGTYIPYMSITQYINRSIEVRSLYLGVNYLFNK